MAFRGVAPPFHPHQEQCSTGKFDVFDSASLLLSRTVRHGLTVIVVGPSKRPDAVIVLIGFAVRCPCGPRVVGTSGLSLARAGRRTYGRLEGASGITPSAGDTALASVAQARASSRWGKKSGRRLRLFPLLVYRMPSPSRFRGTESNTDFDAAEPIRITPSGMHFVVVESPQLQATAQDVPREDARRPFTPRLWLRGKVPQFSASGYGPVKQKITVGILLSCRFRAKRPFIPLMVLGVGFPLVPFFLGAGKGLYRAEREIGRHLCDGTGNWRGQSAMAVCRGRGGPTDIRAAER